MTDCFLGEEDALRFSASDSCEGGIIDFEYKCPLPFLSAIHNYSLCTSK